MSLVSFCDLAHNVFTGNKREQSRLIFNKALSVTAVRAFVSIAGLYVSGHVQVKRIMIDFS